MATIFEDIQLLLVKYGIKPPFRGQDMKEALISVYECMLFMDKELDKYKSNEAEELACECCGKVYDGELIEHQGLFCEGLMVCDDCEYDLIMEE